MNKEIISDSQGRKTTVLFIFGSTLVMGTGGESGRDMWLSIAIAVILAIPAVLLYSRILYLFPGKDWFEILEQSLGKFFGKLISLIYTWFAFHLGALILRNFGEFIVTVALPETPMIVPIICYAFLCMWVVKAGIETIGKCSDYFIVFVMFLIILYGLLALKSMDTDNVLPIMGQGVKYVLAGVPSAFTYPFGETVVFLAVFSALQNKKSAIRVYVPALIFAGLVVTYIALRNIMVLGPLTIKAVYFPSYSAIGRINVGNFIQRIEIGVTIVFLLSGFIKVSICMLAAVKGFSRVLGYKDYRMFVMPIGLLMVNLAFIIYTDIEAMFEWAFKVWPYYAFPFEVILPVLLWILIEIKEKMKNRPQETEAPVEEGASS